MLAKRPPLLINPPSATVNFHTGPLLLGEDHPPKQLLLDHNRNSTVKFPWPEESPDWKFRSHRFWRPTIRTTVPSDSDSESNSSLASSVNKSSSHPATSPLDAGCVSRPASSSTYIKHFAASAHDTVRETRPTTGYVTSALCGVYVRYAMYVVPCPGNGHGRLGNVEAVR